MLIADYAIRHAAHYAMPNLSPSRCFANTSSPLPQVTLMPFAFDAAFATIFHVDFAAFADARRLLLYVCHITRMLPCAAMARLYYAAAMLAFLLILCRCRQHHADAR